MRTWRGWRRLAAGALLAGLPLAVGCQTYLGGMTLPSPFYMQDNPDFIPRGPQFPLTRELARQQEAARNVAQPGGPPLPNP